MKGETKLLTFKKILVAAEQVNNSISFFLKDFIYLFMIDIEKERQREKQALCREPNVGLDPGTRGSQPRAKGRRQTTEPPRDPK